MNAPSPDTSPDPPGPSRKLVFGLKTYFSLMLAAVSTVSFLVSGMVLFIYRVPQITEATRAALTSEAQNLALRTELILAGLETQLALVSSLLLADADEQNLQFILSSTADKSSRFSAVYQLDKNGTVVRAAVQPPIDERRRQELLGNDYSRMPHVINLRESVTPVWSEEYISNISDSVTVAVGARVGEGALIAEVPLEHILRSLQTSKGAGEAAVWLLDNKGEMLADSEDSSRGLLLSPLLALWVARPLATITRQARRVANGELPGPWPEGRSLELNNLSADLDRMARSLLARERELEAIFNASPIGIAVTSLGRQPRIIKVNDTLLQLFGHPRQALIGRSSADLNMWADPRDRERLFQAVEQGQEVEMETWGLRADGGRFLAAHTARTYTDASGQDRFAVIVLRDITELRRIEDEIRHLNADLERRVQERTQELVQTNDRLSTTLESLQRTQDELVRAEKLASLGALVAGIAHELNTPLGNGVMAVSTMRAALSSFQVESAQGLKRSSLDRLVAAMEMGSDIAQRNLQRAAELVTSFKQVAADQTSAQRRRFDLREVCDEIVLTLRPVLKQCDAQVVMSVPEGLVLDSYPGALWQVLTNLVTNAITHAFEGHTSPRITITAAALGPDRVAMNVADNGQGIAPELLPRIFDPFVTTRMGRGGTGLGLHIVHNLVFNTLGGSVSVKSQVGEGTEFQLELPLIASAQAKPE